MSQTVPDLPGLRLAGLASLAPWRVSPVRGPGAPAQETARSSLLCLKGHSRELPSSDLAGTLNPCAQAGYCRHDVPPCASH